MQVVDEVLEKHASLTPMLTTVEELVVGTATGRAPACAKFCAYWEAGLHQALHDMILQVGAACVASRKLLGLEPAKICVSSTAWQHVWAGSLLSSCLPVQSTGAGGGLLLYQRQLMPGSNCQ